MADVFASSMYFVGDSYALDCTLLALFSLLAAWKPTILTKLFFMGKHEAALGAEKAFRFIAFVCAGGAILAIALRVLQKGK